MKKLLLILLCLPMIGFGQCVSGDCVNGYGIYIYTNFESGRYVGKFKNSKKDGEGIYIYDNGEKYAGEWKNNIMEGQGIKTWANGDICVGEWSQYGKFIIGKKTYSDGKIEEGIFYFGDYVEEE